MKATNPSNWKSGDPYELFPEVAKHDADVSLSQSQEEVVAELKRKGFNIDKLNKNATKLLEKVIGKQKKSK